MTNMTPRNTRESESGLPALPAEAETSTSGGKSRRDAVAILAEACRLYGSGGDGHFVAHHKSGKGLFLLTNAAAIKAMPVLRTGPARPDGLEGVAYFHAAAVSRGGRSVLPARC